MHHAGTGLLVALVVGLGGPAWGEPATPASASSEKSAPPDLAGYRTVAQAITTRISRSAAQTAGQTGYLGIHVATDPRGRLVLAEVADDSPAARAGLRPGDVLARLDGTAVATAAAVRDLLQSRSPGEQVKLAVLRQEKPVEATVALGATSRPLKPSGERVTLGVQLGRSEETDGVPIEQVTPDSPAAAAGLKPGDLLLKLDGQPLGSVARLSDTLAERKPGDRVTLTVRRGGKDIELAVTLAADQGRGGRFGGRDVSLAGWDTRTLTYFTKDLYRLAVICIEYPDVKHNPQIASREWEHALFSRNIYAGRTNATGQPVHGSLNDYYQEQSHGALRVEGKVLDWVEVSKKRADYSQGTGTMNRGTLLTEAIDRLLARDGKNALDGFDGLFFLYAGERVQTTRGGLYWPHRATLAHQGKRWAYFICPEGGRRMGDISVICHEFGHMLGMPDLYARPENPGSEGLGVWCAMSNQNGNGRPQHFGAWCKEQLGWLSPAVIDPTVRQKLILSPVEDSPRECFKVLVRPDGSEYLLLENRRRKGFDRDLPAEGLLIWRVVGNRPMLEESHGIDGPTGPRMFLTSVPYPSAANNAYTPYTTPSSRSHLGGGLPVHITNIRKLPDGRITFYIGYDFQ